MVAGDRARTVGAAVLAGLLFAPGAAVAFPDGAPWGAVCELGCAECHFDRPPDLKSDALRLDGLPEAFVPGERYPLRIRLAAPGQRAAGFLISAWQGGQGAGRFIVADGCCEAQGGQARSAVPETSGEMAEWQVVWQAPESPDGSVLIELWANVANDDRSPLGDATHRRVGKVPPRR